MWLLHSFLSIMNYFIQIGSTGVEDIVDMTMLASVLMNDRKGGLKSRFFF